MMTNEDDLLLNDDNLQILLSNEKLDNSISDIRAILYGKSNSPFIYKQPKDSQNSYINDDEIQSSISTQISESTYSVSEEKTVWEDVMDFDKKQVNE